MKEPLVTRPIGSMADLLGATVELYRLLPTGVASDYTYSGTFFSAGDRHYGLSDVSVQDSEGNMIEHREAVVVPADQFVLKTESGSEDGF